MSKRASGPPRRPRNPIARDVHTPLYRQRVIPDKRWQTRLRDEDGAKNNADDHLNAETTPDGNPNPAEPKTEPKK